MPVGDAQAVADPEQLQVPVPEISTRSLSRRNGLLDASATETVLETILRGLKSGHLARYKDTLPLPMRLTILLFDSGAASKLHFVIRIWAAF